MDVQHIDDCICLVMLFLQNELAKVFKHRSGAIQAKKKSF